MYTVFLYACAVVGFLVFAAAISGGFLYFLETIETKVNKRKLKSMSIEHDLAWLSERITQLEEDAGYNKIREEADIHADVGTNAN